MTPERFAAMSIDERRQYLAEVSAVLHKVLGGAALDPDWKTKEPELFRQVLKRGESGK